MYKVSNVLGMAVDKFVLENSLFPSSLSSFYIRLHTLQGWSCFPAVHIEDVLQFVNFVVDASVRLL